MIRGNNIGVRIEELRKNKKLHQSEVAIALGVKRETIAQWESNDREIKAKSIAALAQFFDVTTDFILGISDVKSYNLTTQSLHKVTGLSEKAIMNLRQIRKAGEDGSLDNPLLVINALLESVELPIGICEMVSALIRGNPPEMSKEEMHTMNGGRYWTCQNAFMEIIKALVVREVANGQH